MDDFVIVKGSTIKDRARRRRKPALRLKGPAKIIREMGWVGPCQGCLARNVTITILALAHDGTTVTVKCAACGHVEKLDTPRPSSSSEAEAWS